MARIKSIGMIILMQPDLEAAVTFYKKLGLSLKFHLKNHWAEFRLHDIKIGLCPTSRDTTILIRTGIVFEVDDLYGLYETLKGSVEFIGEPTKALHGIMVSFKDVGGNILDLYQPTPEKVTQLVHEVSTTDEANSDCCRSSKIGSRCCKNNK